MTADTDSATQYLLRPPSQISPSGTGESSSIERSPGLSPSLTLLFSITSALAVANVYFAQPLLDSMAQSLGVASSMIGVVVTATQVGYALGLLFIVPLGDLVNRKRLILTQVLLSAVALAGVGAAQQWLTLLGAQPINLGPQTPLWDLVQSAEALQADVLAVSFTAAAPAPLVQDTLTELRSKLPRHVALWAGGQHPLLHRRPPADITVLGQISDLSTTVQSWRQAHPRRVPSAA